MDKEIAQQILAALKSGADVVSTELPLVAAQLINWIIAENAIWSLFALIVGIMAVRYQMWWNSQGDRRPTDTEATFWFLSWVFGVISVPVFMCNFFGLVKVLVAPKIVLIEYLAWFVK